MVGIAGVSRGNTGPDHHAAVLASQAVENRTPPPTALGQASPRRKLIPENNRPGSLPRQGQPPAGRGRAPRYGGRALTGSVTRIPGASTSPSSWAGNATPGKSSCRAFSVVSCNAMNFDGFVINKRSKAAYHQLDTSMRGSSFSLFFKERQRLPLSQAVSVASDVFQLSSPPGS